MKNIKEEILLRTFDLPDIYFSRINGLKSGKNSFQVMRNPASESVDSIALDKWYKQSRHLEASSGRRDCWLQVKNRIYLIWGAAITSRSAVDNNCERWNFDFAEMKIYRNSTN